MKQQEIQQRLSGIINFDYDVLYQISDIFDIIDGAVTEYLSLTCDLESLEHNKIKIAGNLVYLSRLFGEVKRFKGNNHTFLEDARKRVKALCLKEMEGSITANRELVYDYPKFVEKLEAIEHLKKKFITIEELFKSYERIFQSITQSISKETKQFQGGV